MPFEDILTQDHVEVHHAEVRGRRPVKAASPMLPHCPLRRGEGLLRGEVDVRYSRLLR